MEMLEDRTLLSYGPAAAALTAELQALAGNLGTDLGDSVPLIGQALKGLAPVVTVFNQFETDISNQLTAATDPDNLRYLLNMSPVLQPLLNGGVATVSPSLSDDSILVTIPIHKVNSRDTSATARLTSASGRSSSSMQTPA